MSNNRSPRQDRKERLIKPKNGASASFSADFIISIKDIVALAKSSAFASSSKNTTLHALAIIPMLFSALRCFIIESAYFPNSWEPDSTALDILANDGDFKNILKHYNVPNSIYEDAILLYEIRNEIIHPNSLPTGTPNNCPEYLMRIKNMGLFEETGRQGSHFNFIDQICSLKLIVWACRCVRDITMHINAYYSSRLETAIKVNFLSDNFSKLVSFAEGGVNG